MEDATAQSLFNEEALSQKINVSKISRYTVLEGVQ